MKDEEILKEALEKAFPDKRFQEDLIEYVRCQLEKDGGYRLIFYHEFARAFWGEEVKHSDVKIPCKKCGHKMWYYEVCGISHWDGWFRCSCGNRLGEERSEEIIKSKVNAGWEYHLQKMALEPNPLKYLKKFLPKLVGGEKYE